MPLPSLIFVAVLTIVFGTDHPNGKWANRHLPPPPQVAPTEFDEAKKESEVEVQQLDDDNARLTQETMTEVLTNPMTWLPALAYTSPSFPLFPRTLTPSILLSSHVWIRTRHGRQPLQHPLRALQQPDVRADKGRIRVFPLSFPASNQTLRGRWTRSRVYTASSTYSPVQLVRLPPLICIPCLPMY